MVVLSDSYWPGLVWAGGVVTWFVTGFRTARSKVRSGMAARIEDHLMAAEYGGRVIATAVQPRRAAGDRGRVDRGGAPPPLVQPEPGRHGDGARGTGRRRVRRRRYRCRARIGAVRQGPVAIRGGNARRRGGGGVHFP